MTAKELNGVWVPLKKSLAQARQKVLAIKLNGLKDTSSGRTKFKNFYLEAIEHIKEVKQWKHPKSESQWKSTIAMYALPFIGDKALDKITTDDICKLIEPIYKTKTETASKLIGRLKAVFDYAQVKGFRKGYNPAVWSGNLDQYFAPKTKVSQIQHHKAVPWQDIPKVFKALWELKTIGSLSVMFGTLTASRVKEFALAEWQEIDWENDIWVMPAGRRKDQKLFPHRVPLNKQIKMVLDRLPTRENFLFPSVSGDSHLCLENPRKVLRDLGLDVTMHGMRSSFRDWAAETGQDWAASEKALSHTVGSEVTQAYLRTDMLEKRREIMQAWADWCFSEIKSGD